jgi:hypothetical protein
VRPDAGAITDLDKNLKTKDCDLGDANEHGITPTPSSPTCKDNTTCPYVNTTKSLASVPIPASGGQGSGSTCAAGNCTTGTPPPGDCTKNPNDPSCAQTLTPSTTSPTTKTCPDGSVIDANANCPTQSNPSPSNNPPPTNNNPPSSPNNNPPPSSGSGNNGGSNSGSGSGGGI